MRLTHLADYAVVLMTAAARCPAGARLSATELSGDTGVPLPTAQKLMGQLAGRGLLTSVRGAGGGFALARPADEISLADIVEAVEGPIALTMCADRSQSRMRARRPLPGQAAHGHRRQCRARRARRGSLKQLCSPRRPGSSLRSSVRALDSGLRREQSHERGRQEPRAQGEDRPGLRVGLLVRHRAGVRAQGPERRHRPLHLGQEGRARVDARLAAQGLSRLARDGGGQLGQARHSRRSITRTPIITPRPRPSPSSAASTRSIPKSCRVYEKLGIPIEEQKVLAGVEGARKVAVDAVFDSVSVATTFREELKKAGVIFLSISEAIREYPELVQKVSRQRRPAARQLFRLPQQRGLLRRHLRLRARGRPLPDGAVAPISASMPRTPASSSAP